MGYSSIVVAAVQDELSSADDPVGELMIFVLSGDSHPPSRAGARFSPNV